MIEETLFEAEEKMEKAVEHSREEFTGIRTGRAHPSLFNRIVVDYYGATTPLQQLASFHVVDARMITITPYDRSSLNAIEKAIRNSDLGVNPGNDGHLIRVALPQLTEERRRDYIKLARTKAEEGRVSIRNIRRHAKETLDKLAKDGEVGKDDVKRAQEQLDDLTRTYVEHIDELVKSKEAELLEV